MSAALSLEHGWARKQADRTLARLTPRQIGKWAVVSLYDEVALYPKPGLVSFVDSGSHSDMDGQTFMRSLFSLRHYFCDIAQLGLDGASFPALERCGMNAETTMLQATGGVNTHRGAIFSLGLLSAAAGAVSLRQEQPSPQAVRAELMHRWGAALAHRAQRAPQLPGGVAARLHGLRSASQEASLGFPVLFETTFPALCSALDRGLDPGAARLEALLHTIAVMDDCNLAHRGGLAGLHFAQQQAQGFLASGGMARQGAHSRLQTLHQAFVERRLSPGGAADMLAAACLLLRLQRHRPRPWVMR